VDDVISAGTAIREAKAILDGGKAMLTGVVVALDRQEKTGKDGELSSLSAVQSVQKEFGVQVLSVVGLQGLLAYLERTGGSLAEHIDAVRVYRKQYGVDP